METPWAFDAVDPVDRFRQFVLFGDWWFADHSGGSELSDLDLDFELNGLQIPAVLSEFYIAARRWPFMRCRLSFGWNQNGFAYPGSLTDSAVYKAHGLVEFAFENQGVTSWACELTGDDPAVYDLQAEGDQVGESHAYPGGRASASLADFLIEFLLMEFAFRGQAVGRLPRLERLLAEDPEQENVLFESATTGEGVRVGLFASEILILRTGSAPSASEWITPRNDEAARLLDPFAGGLSELRFRWATLNDAGQTIDWNLTVQSDGKGLLQPSENERHQILGQDEFRLDLDLESSHESLAAGIAGEKSASHSVQLICHWEGGTLVGEDEALKDGYINPSLFGLLLGRCVDAIEDPTDALRLLFPTLVDLFPTLRVSEGPLTAVPLTDEQWAAAVDPVSAALLNSRWVLPGAPEHALKVVFRREGRMGFESPLTKRSMRGKWSIDGDQLEFDCDGDNVYKFRIADVTMVGEHSRAGKTRATSLTLLVD